MAARQKGDYTEILIRQKVISPDQLAEARQMAKDQAMKLPDALVRLGYATGEEVMRAMAEQHRPGLRQPQRSVDSGRR